MSIRVRFAPSPTGHIHVGNVRTALFNFLFARGQGGTFILRIEDTDLERSSVESEQLIYEDLKWLGFTWDEGPGVGGDYGPYRQTERFDLYLEYANKLLAEGKAYKCFCSKEEIEADREKAAAENRTYLYPGTCRNLTPEQVASREAAGEKGSIRFRVDVPAVHVSDMVKGEIDFPTEMFGDFIIVRSDGAPIYNYVVVLDDALMQITHVIRGDDHLSNTPKQVLLYEALGMKAPLFAHIPMILGPDKSKLSKRHGNTSVEQFRKDGYLADALFNFMALLSWSDAEGREVMTREELTKVFTLDRVSNSAAVFDFTKLNWMNGMYIRAMETAELARLGVPFVAESGLATADALNADFDRYTRMVKSVQDKFETLKELPDHLSLYYAADTGWTDEVKELFALPTSRAVIEGFAAKVAAEESLTVERYKEITKELQTETGAKGKALFMVIRAALTGRTKGPELDQFVTIVTPAELAQRAQDVLARMG